MELPFIHKYYILNDTLQPVARKAFSYPPEASRVYEVIRVMDGVFLFLEDHIDRLQNSISLTQHTIQIDRNSIQKQLCLLLASNGCPVGNVRLEMICHPKQTTFIAGFVPHFYPPPHFYAQGIKVVPLQAVRQNPNAKIFREELRRKAEEILRDQSIYEVILINKEGMITEGSKSNFFAVKEGKLVTPPSHLVLPGISRRQILAIASENNIPVSEEFIPLNAVPHFEALFISGTSPKILPISTFGSISFSPNHPIVTQLRELFDKRIQAYVLAHRHLCDPYLNAFTTNQIVASK